MFDAIFRFFFNLSPVVFSQGEYRFAPTTGSYVAVVLVGAAAALTIIAYRSGRGRARDRAALAGIRLAILAIILICLFRPLLVVKAAAAQQNFVAVLLDDSRSMQIADVDGQPRANYVKSEFGANDRGLLKALSDRFTVRTFRFSTRADAHHAGERVDVQRLAVAARRGAVRRAAGAGRIAGGRAGDGQRRRRHRRCRARRGVAGPQGRNAAGVHGRRRTERRCRKTSRSGEWPRRRTRSRARR